MFEEGKAVLIHRFTKISAEQYDTLEDNYEYFRKMNEEFNSNGNRMIEFYYKDVMFTTIDTWDNSFHEYLKTTQ